MVKKTPEHSYKEHQKTRVGIIFQKYQKQFENLIILKLKINVES